MAQMLVAARASVVLDADSGLKWRGWFSVVAMAVGETRIKVQVQLDRVSPPTVSDEIDCF